MNQNPHDEYGNLVVTLSIGETLLIEDGFITVTAMKKNGNQVRLSLWAPKSVKIGRETKEE